MRTLAVSVLLAAILDVPLAGAEAEAFQSELEAVRGRPIPDILKKLEIDKNFLFRRGVMKKSTLIRGASSRRPSFRLGPRSGRGGKT